MSAEGISVFYGADNVDTVIKEIYDTEFPVATVATFKNLRKLNILDLTNINNIEYPSICDKKKRHHRSAISFLRELNKNLIKPIHEMKSIEYIPSQIMAEYFRYLYTYKGEVIDGIK